MRSSSPSRPSAPSARWAPSGATQIPGPARPGTASRTGSGTWSSSQRAKPSVKPRGDVLDDEDRDRERRPAARRAPGERRRAADRRADPDHRGGARRAEAARGVPVPAQRAARVAQDRDAAEQLHALAERRARPRRRDRGSRAGPCSSTSSAPARERGERLRRARAPRAPASTRIGTGCALMICSIASPPDIPGSSMSIVTRCGLRSSCARRAIAASAVGQIADHVDLRIAREQPREPGRVGLRVLADEDAPRARRRRSRHRPTSRSTVSSRSCWSNLRLTM